MGFNVIIDTREQTPWTFQSTQVDRTVRAKLDTGDYAIEGLINTISAFPTLLLGLAIALIVKPGQPAIVLAITIGWWPQFAQVIRGEVMFVKTEEYILASQALGSSHVHTILRGIIPNVIAPIIVLITVTTGQAIIIEATLSFLGLGIRPPQPSWGLMISDARAYIEIYPWMVISPGLAISLIVLAFNLLGDGLRDTLDPYLTKGRGSI